MQGINFTDSTNLAAASDKQRAAYIAQRRATALHAVTAENRQAAISDSFEGYTASASGSFRFDFSLEASSQITWDGSAQGMQLPAQFSSEFSLQLSISIEGQVSLGDGVTADDKQVSGDDFSMDRQGILKLLQELAKRLGLDGEQQVDLGGKLDDQAMDLLQRLGLVDKDGRATELLQFLSDYANLNRFHAGQQVSAPKDTYSDTVSAAQRVSLQIQAQYGITVKTVGAAPAAAPDAAPAAPEADGDVNAGAISTGGNVVNASNVQGGVHVDDRDTVNIYVNNGDGAVQGK